MKKTPRNSAEIRGVSLLTSRAGILAVVLFLSLLSLAIPMKQLLDQQTRITELRARQAENLALVNKLESEVLRWQDPAYVKAQARSRLHYVMPHEVGYIVLEADEVNSVASVSTNSTNTRPAWYTVMWNSLEDAGKTAPPLLVSVDE
jgi:cell division protein FtsB